MADEQNKTPNPAIEAIKRGWTGFANWMGENTAHKVIFGFSTAAVLLVAGASVAMGPVAQSVIMPIANAVQTQSTKTNEPADTTEPADEAATTDAAANAATPEEQQTPDNTEAADTNNAEASSSNNNSSNSSSSNNSNSSSNNNSSGSSSNNSSAATHTHTWVAKTRTVTDEAGHWKVTKQEWDETISTTNRTCKHYRCTKCGAVGDHNLGAVDHKIDNCDGSLTEITRYDNPNPTTEYTTKHHDAEKEWVPSVTHTETYYVCSGCGAEQ